MRSDVDRIVWEYLLLSLCVCLPVWSKGKREKRFGWSSSSSTSHKAHTPFIPSICPWTTPTLPHEIILTVLLSYITLFSLTPLLESKEIIAFIHRYIHVHQHFHCPVIIIESVFIQAKIHSSHITRNQSIKGREFTGSGSVNWRHLATKEGSTFSLLLPYPHTHLWMYCCNRCR